MKIDQDMIERAAAAIANARGMRRGAPEIRNVMQVLPKKLALEVREDAECALKAALAIETNLCPRCSAPVAAGFVCPRVACSNEP